jgi:hypothetical protein
MIRFMNRIPNDLVPFFQLSDHILKNDYQLFMVYYFWQKKMDSIFLSHFIVVLCYLIIILITKFGSLESTKQVKIPIGTLIQHASKFDFLSSFDLLHAKLF